MYKPTGDEQSLYRGTLISLDQRTSQAIRQCENESALRQFACRMTRLAMQEPVQVKAEVVAAIEAAEDFLKGNRSLDEFQSLREQVEIIASLLEQTYWMEFDEDGEVPSQKEQAVAQIYTHSLIAKCAACCLHPWAKLAAACAAYDANFAIGDDSMSEEEYQQAKRELTKLLE